MVISVDTSVIMAVILNEPTKPDLIEVTLGTEMQSAPSLPWEVGNALTALLRRGRIDLRQARAAVGAWAGIPVRLAGVDLERAVEIAESHGIYAYDAYVLECALHHGTPLLSLDRRQCEVAGEMGIEVLEVGT
jgi:predicted nucleic acid-binding protein